jgi:hydrogenase nickel incorporation protein HypA/HybF
VHELAITESLVAAVTERLPGTKVTCVQLEVGALSGVVSDSLRFCFDLVTEGTDLEGSTLEITETAARCRCHACAADFEPDGPCLLCPCGSAEVTVMSGQDLRVAAVRVA